MDVFDFFSELGGGATSERFWDEIQMVCDRSRETGGKGTVTLQITIDPKEDRINFLPVIKSNLPKREQIPVSFFLGHTASGKPVVMKNDPNQPELIPMDQQRPRIVEG